MSEQKTSAPNIRELYRLAKEVQDQPPIQITEDELTKNEVKKSQNSIFANEDMIKKFEALPEDVKGRFQNYGQEYYSRIIDNVAGSIERSAANNLLAVRGGVSPKDLTPDELMILRTIYGNEWYTLAGLESEQDD
jgi:hypothetical protein